MTDLRAGDKAPAFTLPDDKGNKTALGDLKGQKIVLYFYPKDDTPGCTKEACDFNDNLKALNKLNVAVLGVSKDSPESHAKFKKKYGLKFPLLSDENGKVCEKYGVWIEKSMYGRKYMGIDRSTFLIDESGKIQALWRKVSVTNHIRDILKELQ